MTSLDFRNMLSAAKDEQVLIPATHAALYSPTFTGFDIPVRGWTTREYDGWFHPSAHSTWTVRQLYLYLVAPNLLEAEHMGVGSVFAVTSGSFWHEFLQRLWLQTGHLVQAEVPIRDKGTNRTGHADGMLTNGDCLEIKSINEFQVLKINNEAILREKKPEYWAQTQDYLDVLGVDRMRYFTITPSWPFAMSEFVVKADKAYQVKRRGEYMQAMELATKYPDASFLNDMHQVEISECCAPGSAEAKRCDTKRACPIGRVKV